MNGAFPAAVLPSPSWEAVADMPRTASNVGARGPVSAFVVGEF